MKIDVTDAASLPAWMQTHVADGKLDLGALPEPEDVTGLKTALQKERANVQAWARLGDKPDAVAQRIADLEKAAQGTGKGAEEAQAKLDAMKAEYEGKLTAAQQRAETLMRSQAASALKAELAKVGVVPEGLDLLAGYASNRIAFNDDGSPKVMTADGKPMIGSGADHGATLSDLAKELAASIPHLVADGGKGGSGKQPGSTGGTPQGKTVRAGELAAMTPKDKAAFYAANPGVSIIE